MQLSCMLFVSKVGRFNKGISMAEIRGRHRRYFGEYNRRTRVDEANAKVMA